MTNPKNNDGKLNKELRKLKMLGKMGPEFMLATNFLPFLFLISSVYF